MTERGWHLFTSSLTSKALVAFPNCRTKYKKLTFFCLGLFSLIFLIIWLSCKILLNYKSFFPFHTFNLLRNASWCIYLLKNRTVGDVWLSLLTRRIVFLCFLLSVFQFPCWRVVITFFNFLFWIASPYTSSYHFCWFKIQGLFLFLNRKNADARRLGRKRLIFYFFQFCERIF